MCVRFLLRQSIAHVARQPLVVFVPERGERHAKEISRNPYDRRLEGQGWFEILQVQRQDGVVPDRQFRRGSSDTAADFREIPGRAFGGVHEVIYFVGVRHPAVHALTF